MYRLFKIIPTQKNRHMFQYPGLYSQRITSNMLFCTLFSRNNTSSNICKKCSRYFTSEELGKLLTKQIKKKSKSKKSKKTFAELVEINENHSNITKARVKKLNAEHMSKLTDKPEITLEQLHCLMQKKTDTEPFKLSTEENSELSDSLLNANLFSVNSGTLEKKLNNEIRDQLIQYNNENIDMFLDSDLRFRNDEEIENSSTVTNEIISNANADLTKKKKKVVKTRKGKKMTKLNMSDENKKLVNETFNQNLISYIGVCLNCDMLSVAFSTLLRYSKKSKYTLWCSITDPLAFNLLMHGFAAKGDMKKIQELMQLMKNCKVSYTPQTFAACFECVTRIPTDLNTIEILRNIQNQLESSNFTFQDLFDKCVYVRDQQTYVLKAIHQLDPNFQPHYNDPVLLYSNPLLTDLNELENRFHSPAYGLFTMQEMDKLINEQFLTEVNSIVKIKSIAKIPKTKRIEEYRQKWADLQNVWRMSIREGYAREMKTLRLQRNNAKLFHSLNIFPYLKVLTLEQYVDIILQEVLKLVQGSETFSPHVKLLYKEIGNKVKLMYEIKCKQHDGISNKINKIYKEYCAWYLNPIMNTNSMNTRQQWQNLLIKFNAIEPSLNSLNEKWSSSVCTEIGKFLYNIIIRDVKVNVNIFTPKPGKYLPAFYTLFRYQGSHQIEEIKPHPLLLKLYREMMIEDLYFDVNLLPMVSPPVPWSSLDQSCYIMAKTDLIRMSNIGDEELRKKPIQELYPAFDALNQLASIPWRINNQVLDVVLKVFREGGSKELDVPQPPSEYKIDPNYIKSDNKISFHNRLVVLRRKAEMYSLWCEALYRLSLAHYYRDRIFWLPHNMDFRGRVYPIPPHLTHLGSDLARSLLKFAKGEKLGPDGLNWLKVHCINLTGLKKRYSIEERLQYANEVLDEILDSAANPLTGRMWWTKSDDKWQTLACCMEIKAVIDSGENENFVSHFPVHQDGSCNGLQHYAALGRDQAGAESVNLTPVNKPQDVYSCVVELVEAEREKDAKNGLEIAEQLKGFITRKIIKQTVMTTVYGVTKYGGRLQIAKQLKDVDNFPKNLVWQASLYLVTKTFLCLQEMFTSSKQIQDWFVKCAVHITTSYQNAVKWETPLGLPVIQPYFKTKVISLNDKIQETSNLFSTISTIPNLMKQKNAFPPNFVHSLDSSHMMLTSIYCEREGITFISVHDCYWTHPCSVNQMNKICRQQFVKLHSQPILENLSKYFIKTYTSLPGVISPEQNNIFLEIPKKGTYNLNEVLDSVYFFS